MTAASSVTPPTPLTPALLQPERDDDQREVRASTSRHSAGDGVVPRLVEALRAAEAPIGPLSYVATVDDVIVGHVLLSACRLDAPHQLVDGLRRSFPVAPSPHASECCGVR
ncbi:hypothetical protein [Actinopolymorpha sp. B9G3]|uniref:hypothetical protein n=1 Tax=Actinopolymorpha sp. B9G3 TaxID=3158970 RepID=UPI0032D8C47E